MSDALACPVCAQTGFTRWCKCNASAVSPAACRHCGALARLDDRVHFAGTLASEIILWGSLVLALALRTWYALLLIPLGIAGWMLLVGRHARLTRIEANEVAAERRSWLRWIVVVAIVGCAAYLVFDRV
jgi:uncharacterized membrane protein